ncbi:hypothetical protein LFADAHJC_LOCUS4346 [Methylorubrum extorquens]|jgi:hypothetical protein
MARRSAIDGLRAAFIVNEAMTGTVVPQRTAEWAGP